MAVLFDDPMPPEPVQQQMRLLCFTCPLLEECRAEALSTDRVRAHSLGFRAGMNGRELADARRADARR